MRWVCDVKLSDMLPSMELRDRLRLEVIVIVMQRIRL